MATPVGGNVQIFIYPVGTEIPPNKETKSGVSKTTSEQSLPVSAAATPKPQ